MSYPSNQHDDTKEIENVPAHLMQLSLLDRADRFLTVLVSHTASQ